MVGEYIGTREFARSFEYKKGNRTKVKKRIAIASIVVVMVLRRPAAVPIWRVVNKQALAEEKPAQFRWVPTGGLTGTAELLQNFSAFSQNVGLVPS